MPRDVGQNPYAEQMDDHAANPAGRLLLYFDEILAKQANRAVQPFAAAYFGLPAGHSDRYLVAMAALMTLPDEVEALVSKIEDPPLPASKLMNPLSSVRSVFEADPLGQQTVQWVQGAITPQVRSELDTTSHVLNKYLHNGHAIRDDSLTQIKGLAELIVELALADEGLDAEARAAFIRHAHRIVEAADLYKVAGAQPLIDELDRFHQAARRMKTPPGEKLWQATKQLTGAVVLAVELFMVPVNVDNAIEFYGDLFAQPQIIEAPGLVVEPEIVVAEIVEDDNSAA